MISRLRAGLLTALLAVPIVASADPPRLTGTSPLGVGRGKAMDIVLRGTGLGEHPRLVAPFAFRLEEAAIRGVDPAVWKVRLVVDPRTAVGIYPIRVVTDEGISNPLLFAVGQVPQVREIEPNDTFAGAQAIQNPVAVEGECEGNDKDFFVFPGRQGDRIVVDAVCSRIGSGIDPTIRLTTSDARFVASADDTPGLFTDGYLTTVLPEDGDYVLEFCDSRYAGTGRAVYRLLIGRVPFAIEVSPLSLPRGQNVALELRGGTLSGDRLFALRAPSDPMAATFYPAIPARSLGDPAWADSDLDVELPMPVLLGDVAEVAEPADPAQKLPPLAPPVTILGGLSKAGERDEFTISAPSGSKHEVRIEAWGLGSALDGQLRVLGRDGRLLGEADDGKGRGGRRGGGGGGRRAQGPASTDPAFDLTMPTGQGEVKLVVRDLMDRGGIGFGYRLIVNPVDSSFRLTLGDDSIPIPRGGTALIPVTVERGGYRGPIALEVRGLPEGGGVTARAASVPTGQTSGVIGLIAGSDGPSLVRELQVVGKGDEGRPVAASGTTTFAQQTMTTPGFGMGGTIPSYSRPFVSLTAAVVRPGPLLLKPEASKTQVAQGGTSEIPVDVIRTDKWKETFQLAALSPPTGLKLDEAKVGGGETRIKMKVTAAKDAALGPLTFGLVAQSRSPRAPRADGPGGSPPSSPLAATMITVEVVPAARPK